MRTVQLGDFRFLILLTICLRLPFSHKNQLYVGRIPKNFIKVILTGAFSGSTSSNK